MAGHTARRVGLLLVLVVVVLAVISLVLLSPAALAALNPNGSVDWQRLAHISQTYAAASAILALLALGGVAVSLVFQAREMRANRVHATRLVHMDLLKMAMDDPLYMRSLGPSRFSNDDLRRQSLYVNPLIGYWRMAYEMGEASELHLRAVAADFFAGEDGQRFWRTWGHERIRTSTEKRTRRFHEILDEEYQKATAPPPESPAREESAPESQEIPPDGE